MGHVCVFLILFHDDGDNVGDDDDDVDDDDGGDDDDSLSPCSVYVSPSPACVYVFTGRQAADRSAGHWVSSICHLAPVSTWRDPDNVTKLHLAWVVNTNTCIRTSIATI